MMTSPGVKECALRARSTHGVHHAIVEVNIVIGVVLGEVLVAHVVSLVVDAVIGLALSLIAHVVVVVVFVVAILHRIFCMGDILFTISAQFSECHSDVNSNKRGCGSPAQAQAAGVGAHRPRVFCVDQGVQDVCKFLLRMLGYELHRQPTLILRVST